MTILIFGLTVKTNWLCYNPDLSSILIPSQSKPKEKAKVKLQRFYTIIVGKVEQHSYDSPHTILHSFANITEAAVGQRCTR